MFEWVDKLRDWHFESGEYYDVIIWDVKPGMNSASLYNTIYEVCSMTEYTAYH